MNTGLENVKGSHKRPYVTYFLFFSDDSFRKSKSKARRHSAGQCVNGALAGEKGSKLPHVKFAKKVVANSWFFEIKFRPYCDTRIRRYEKKSVVSCQKGSEKSIFTVT